MRTRSMILALFLCVSTLAAIDNEEKVVKYQLHGKEIEMTPEQLYQKGMSLYNKPAVERKGGSETYLSNRESRDEAMRYLIPAALEGNFDAGVLATEYLSQNPYYPNAKVERFRIAKAMHEAGYPYGTYMLADSYRYGIGVGMNLDIAQVLYEKVNAVCVSQGAKAYGFLDPLKQGHGELRCLMAAQMYDALKSEPHVRTPKAFTGSKEREELKKRVTDMFNQKEREAYEKFQEGK